MFKTLWVITKDTFFGFRDDRCTRLAAAIAYYVLFSIIPLAIFAVSVFGFVLNNENIREELVDQILEVLPLSETDGRTDVTDVVDSARDISGPAAILSLVAALWTSSAMFGAIRSSLNTVWKVDEIRPFVQGKLLDLAQVGGLMLLFVGSTVLTGALRTIRTLSTEHVGPLAGENILWELPPVLLPAVVALLAYFVLYTIVPAKKVAWQEALSGAALATILFEVLKNTFAIYVQNFNNYDVVYGALAGVLLFMFYMFLASNIMLIGAELARSVGDYRADRLAHAFQPGPAKPPVQQRMFRAFKGLFVRTS